jgi:chemotaxis protein MotB
VNPRTPRSRVGHDRWLVSYADFITLMFAFFVVLYAFARDDYRKQMQVSAAIDTAFHSMAVYSKSSDASSPTMPGPAGKPSKQTAEVDVIAPGQVRDDLMRLRDDLDRTLSTEIAAHTVSLEMGRDGLVISLREAGFFDSGSAVPKPAALPALRGIANKLGALPYDIRIEGHTDNVPVHTAEFDSNWDLSSARATRIARLFIEMRAIRPDCISAAGYAEFHPIAGNDTAEGRAQNRRVDLVVMPRIKLDFAATQNSRQSGSWKRITDGDSPDALP